MSKTVAVPARMRVRFSGIRVTAVATVSSGMDTSRPKIERVVDGTASGWPSTAAF